MKRSKKLSGRCDTPKIQHYWQKRPTTEHYNEPAKPSLHSHDMVP